MSPVRVVEVAPAGEGSQKSQSPLVTEQFPCAKLAPHGVASHSLLRRWRSGIGEPDIGQLDAGVRQWLN